MRWGTIKIISLLGGRGSGHVRVADTPLGSGFTTDEVRSGSRCNRQKVGVTMVRVSSSRQGRSRVTDRIIDRRHGALRIPRRLCDRKSRDPHLLVTSFTWSFRLFNYSRCYNCRQQ